MTGRQGWPTIGPPSSLPPGLRVAGMGVRLGAWLIDSLILGLVFVGIVLVAAAVGAIGISPEAERQLQSTPGALPTVAPYVANLPLLAVFAGLLVLVNVGYSAVLVARFRGLPGQLMLSLQVGDAATGKNLGLRRAFLRAVLSIGIPSAGAAGFLYGIVALESSVPWSEVANPQPGGAAETWLAAWAGPILVAMLAFFIWPVVLLLWTATSPKRQGLHDVAARSQVVGRAPALAGFGYSPGQIPGYPPDGWPPGFVPPPGGWPAVNQSAPPAPDTAAEPDVPVSLPVPDR
ncbi:MAG TPA: RDD family protein, partial [Candidatus Limnocylindrales bacterium]